MTDLSSPEIQSTFRSKRRASLITNAAMAVLAVLTFALAVWVAVEKSRFKLTDWSVAVFIALLCALALLFVFTAVWQIFLRKPYRGVMRRFVSEGFEGCGELLETDGGADFELTLAGDKLTLLRRGCSDFVQFDLSPIKSYPTVCGYTARLVREYLTDRCAPPTGSPSAARVTLTDKTRGKPRTKSLVRRRNAPRVKTSAGAARSDVS